MFGGEPGKRSKELEKERDALLEELKELGKKRERGEITEDEYHQRRYSIERALVEIMDRLAQMRFLMGQA